MASAAQTSDRGRNVVLSRGLDLPIDGAPRGDEIEMAVDVAACAVVATDFVGLKPRMLVEEGDKVSLGQPLFEDKRFEGVAYTAPAAGQVRAINRGARRVLQSVVIQIENRDDAVEFQSVSGDALTGLSRDDVVKNLLASGLWTSLRTRPYSKVPDPATTPSAIFITAIDTRPLAGDPAAVIAAASEDFANGVAILSRLTEGTTHVVHRTGAELPALSGANVAVTSFSGPHPAGLVGTHIHFLDPVDGNKMVWHIGYQDVIAVGELFRTGRLPTTKVVAIAGPAAVNPRLVRTRRGASLAELVHGESSSDNLRVISGDVLSGVHAHGALNYIGSFDNQITLLPEGNHRDFFGWIIPSSKKFATAKVHLSSLLGLDKIKFHTNLNGSPRAMIPIGLYEDVMPMDILATQMLRAILVSDTDVAQQLGALELDEEDLALCSYVCMSKYEYGLALRVNLDKIEAEG
ncbi:Na(+)-translocating NADH-quinone reductase subunit A [Sedimentitalea todarodis]|uniref:Na(+)-translocating NADH-quinone reductase subunit A n=1 Tax=Sedimentitalea todarodis TaxID=1631240 RepID=A0ABU3VGR0_9RHOB|nr:Na(+)-translocating NADH-quinone reductase subunit A [Sedimentitalea todarodis]MDU9005371.1 Na(+)-translocating NADH-quinone reductase subunit A [Sedimentitalea todarodis]